MVCWTLCSAVMVFQRELTRECSCGHVARIWSREEIRGLMGSYASPNKTKNSSDLAHYFYRKPNSTQKGFEGSIPWFVFSSEGASLRAKRA